MIDTQLISILVHAFCITRRGLDCSWCSLSCLNYKQKHRYTSCFAVLQYLTFARTTLTNETSAVYTATIGSFHVRGCEFATWRLLWEIFSLHILGVYGLPACTSARIASGPCSLGVRRPTSIGSGAYGDNDAFYYWIQSPVTVVECNHYSGVFLTNKAPAQSHIHRLLRMPNECDAGMALLPLMDRQE
jgi:hypothetical protein